MTPRRWRASAPLSMALPRLIVTRPQPEADRWVEQLRAQGVQAQALPLIEIGPASLPADQQATAQARAQWQRYGAIMLVSGAPSSCRAMPPSVSSASSRIRCTAR